ARDGGMLQFRGGEGTGIGLGTETVAWGFRARHSLQAAVNRSYSDDARGGTYSRSQPQTLMYSQYSSEARAGGFRQYVESPGPASPSPSSRAANVMSSPRP